MKQQIKNYLCLMLSFGLVLSGNTAFAQLYGDPETNKAMGKGGFEFANYEAPIPLPVTVEQSFKNFDHAATNIFNQLKHAEVTKTAFESYSKALTELEQNLNSTATRTTKVLGVNLVSEAKQTGFELSRNASTGNIFKRAILQKMKSNMSEALSFGQKGVYHNKEINLLVKENQELGEVLKSISFEKLNGVQFNNQARKVIKYLRPEDFYAAYRDFGGASLFKNGQYAISEVEELCANVAKKLTNGKAAKIIAGELTAVEEGKVIRATEEAGDAVKAPKVKSHSKLKLRGVNGSKIFKAITIAGIVTIPVAAFATVNNTTEVDSGNNLLSLDIGDIAEIRGRAIKGEASIEEVLLLAQSREAMEDIYDNLNNPDIAALALTVYGDLLFIQEVANQVEEQQVENKAAVGSKLEGGIVEGFGRTLKEVGERYTPNF